MHMKIWLVKRMEKIGYDEFDAKVVCAWTEEGARHVASLRTADEGKSAWTDPSRSMVTEVRTDGEHEEVVLESFCAG
jgi:hypothetical protein